jgi:hypothetical protein
MLRFLPESELLLGHVAQILRMKENGKNVRGLVQDMLQVF